MAAMTLARRFLQRSVWAASLPPAPLVVARSREAVAAEPRQRRSTSSSSGQASTYDVAIIGGGVMGSSVALHLAAMAKGGQRIAVFERDATYELASAPRSAGGIRQQFSLPVNVELSIYGIDFLRSGLRELCQSAGADVDTDVQLRENGYLLLAPSGAGEAALRDNVAVQHAAGAEWITLMDPLALKVRFPWLSTEGVALGAFGERNEGYFDPWAFLQALRKGSQAHGVTYVDTEVVGFERGSKGAICSVALADGTAVSVGTVVNAAGAAGGRVVDMCGTDVTPLPVAARKRSMWLFQASAETASDGVTPPAPDNTPLTIDPSGAYFRSEGSGHRFVCGMSPRPEDDPDCEFSGNVLEHPNHELFEEVIWPALAARVPNFEALRVESSWAGFYEYNTLDQNGVVGWHPEVPNLLVACGFSGHGLQQAPGVGRACAELLVHGAYQNTDVSCLGYDRIVRGEPLFERGIY